MQEDCVIRDYFQVRGPTERSGGDARIRGIEQERGRGPCRSQKIYANGLHP